MAVGGIGVGGIGVGACPGTLMAVAIAVGCVCASDPLICKPTKTPARVRAMRSSVATNGSQDCTFCLGVGYGVTGEMEAVGPLYGDSPRA